MITGSPGGITATLFAPFWGNSQETVTAQLIAAELGVDPAEVAIDLAPTMLHLLGLPIPAHMKGRVLEEAFEGPAQVAVPAALGAVAV